MLVALRLADDFWVRCITLIIISFALTTPQCHRESRSWHSVRLPRCKILLLLHVEKRNMQGKHYASSSIIAITKCDTAFLHDNQRPPLTRETKSCAKGQPFSLPNAMMYPQSKGQSKLTEDAYQIPFPVNKALNAFSSS